MEFLQIRPPAQEASLVRIAQCGHMYSLDCSESHPLLAWVVVCSVQSSTVGLHCPGIVGLALGECLVCQID